MEHLTTLKILGYQFYGVDIADFMGNFDDLSNALLANYSPKDKLELLSALKYVMANYTKNTELLLVWDAMQDQFYVSDGHFVATLFQALISIIEPA